MELLVSIRENSANKRISVVIPFHNGAQYADRICTELYDVLTASGFINWEVILVNDGSFDATASVLNKWAELKNFRAIHLSGNFGQSAALMAGIYASNGDYIFTLTNGLHADAGDVPFLFSVMQDLKVDMVCGLRSYSNKSFFSKFYISAAGKIKSKILGTRFSGIESASIGFKKECLAGFRFFRNAYKFFPALAHMAGFSVIEIHVGSKFNVAEKHKRGLGLIHFVWSEITDTFGVYWMKKRYLALDAYEHHVNRKNMETLFAASGD